MNDVDMILVVDADADHVAHQPVIRQRFRPHRIDFEPRRLDGAFRLCRGALLEHVLADAERDERDCQADSHEDIARARHKCPVLPKSTRGVYNFSR